MNVSGDPRVSVVFPRLEPLLVLVTEFVQYLGTSCAVRLKDASQQVPVGEPVVLDFEDASLPLVRGRLKSRDERLLEVEIVGFHPRDKREFPRVQAGLDLSFRKVTPDAGATVFDAWVERGTAPGDGADWQQPEPFMDLSAAGFGFECERPPAAGDHLLVAFSLPGQEEPFHGVARVVRVQPGEEEHLHRVAVELSHATPAARQALMEKTIDLLRLPGERSR